MNGLEPWETSLVGQWEVVHGQVVGNEAAKRIDTLLAAGHLRRVASTDDGWTVLYQDPEDGRLWELTYPHSGWHGGGPPQMQVVDAEEAARRYKL